MPVPSAVYPASLDSLTNPTATTNRDDPGFELHGVISRIQDILEALEAKVGIGASTPGAGAGVLRRTGTGASGWGPVVTADIQDATILGSDIALGTILGGLSGNLAGNTVESVNIKDGTILTADIGANQIAIRRLSYDLSADVSGAVVTPSGYTLIADQSFTIGTANSVVQVALCSNAIAEAAGTQARLLAQVQLDASGSPQASQWRAIGGGYGLAASNVFDPFGGNAAVTFTNLVAGTHTVRVVLSTYSTNVNFICRPASFGTEFLNLSVTEFQR